MPWKTFFHTVEKFLEVFPLHGKIAETFSTPWKTKPAKRRRRRTAWETAAAGRATPHFGCQARAFGAEFPSNGPP